MFLGEGLSCRKAVLSELLRCFSDVSSFICAGQKGRKRNGFARADPARNAGLSGACMCECVINAQRIRQHGSEPALAQGFRLCYKTCEQTCEECVGWPPAAEHEEIGALHPALPVSCLICPSGAIWGGLGLQSWLIKEPTEREISPEAFGLFAKSRWLL